MRRHIAVAAFCLTSVLVCTPHAFGGANATASFEFTATPEEGDTLTFAVSAGGLQRTRVVHLVFAVPQGLEFLAWQDGELLPDPMRVGPAFHEPTRTLLVALAVTGSATTESSGEVGEVKFVRIEGSATMPSLIEACVVDGSHREDWIVTPANAMSPSPSPDQTVLMPRTFALTSVSPNPMSSHTMVRFAIPRPGSVVTIKVYAVTGRAVRTLADEHRAPGYHSEVWDLTDDHGRKVAPGVYFCRMEAGSFKDTKKLVLLR